MACELKTRLVSIVLLNFEAAPYASIGKPILQWSGVRGLLIAVFGESGILGESISDMRGESAQVCESTKAGGASPRNGESPRENNADSLVLGARGKCMIGVSQEVRGALASGKDEEFAECLKTGEVAACLNTGELECLNRGELECLKTGEFAFLRSGNTGELFILKSEKVGECMLLGSGKMGEHRLTGFRDAIFESMDWGNCGNISGRMEGMWT